MGKIKIGDYQPCPFCGTPNDIELSRVDIQDREGFPVAMSCATCGCVGPWDYCPVSDENYWLATAVHKWNQQAALNELAQLRAERDALKARVEELTEVANYAANVCNAATISTSKSEETAYAIGMLERAICRPYQVNASERNTTPGGDE